MTAREITHRYGDPLDRIWIGTAAKIGLRVERSAEVYASSDGRGSVTIGTPETLDADDSLAQMLFHEICHTLVQGRASLETPDWGLDNEGDRDLVREHACLRTQAFLADRHGLRRFFAPTTDHRTTFWDGLGADPLAPRRAASCVLARPAIARAAEVPWAPHLETALAATAEIVRRTAAIDADPSSLHRLVDDETAPHPAGGRVSRVHAGRGETCGTCVWSRRTRCRVHRKRVRADWVACESWEPALECTECAACCREAYHAVELGKRDPVRRLHPELVVLRDGRATIPRDDGRCAALDGGEGGGAEDAPFACRIYETRPRTCRDFEIAGSHCLTARRRVGLSL